MSFDDYLKQKTLSDRIGFLIKRNAWRLEAFAEKPRASRKFINHSAGSDGIRLAEILNPITENI